MSRYYEESGVSLSAGYQSVERIKKHVAKTYRPGVMGTIGAFGGAFDLSALNFKEPVLISGTDGVGTKLLLASMANRYDTIGIDLVAMCVNDVLAQGAQPLYFLDYIAVGKNYPERIEALVRGIADGCVLADCALIGGETAEMPDMYGENDVDLAGFCVGAVEKSKMIRSTHVSVGQVVIGLPSSGLHSNGYSLVRKLLFKDHQIPLDYPLGQEKLIDVLLKPTRIYVKSVLALLDHIEVKGIAHITGGGFIENMPRCLSEHQGIKIVKGSWTIPPIFSFLRELGQIDEEEMYAIFNMGIGMILIIDPKDVTVTMEILSEQGESPVILGEVIAGEGVVFK